MSTIDLNNYTCSNVALFMPFINEYTWNKGVRAFLYLLAMLWVFLGIAIVADAFMCGIEKITSKTRIIEIPDPNKKDSVKTVEVKVWNDTVANLSLMAFGTSAPEILLAVIEITGNKFKAGQLGPGTIVGSAAFNLLIITSICIVSIQNGDSRKIKNLPVHIVTSVFSLLAYIWLIVILKLSSAGRVDIWEAVVTFCMFPILILTSFAVDKGCWCRKKNKTSSETEIGLEYSKSPDDSDSIDSIDIIHLAKELSRNKELKEDEVVALTTKKLLEKQHHNAGWYRVHAVRGLTGGPRLIPKVKDTLKDLYQKISTDYILKDEHEKVDVSMVDLSEGGFKSVVEFTASSCAVLENEGKVRIGIKRYGKLDSPVDVWVETIDGTAEAGSDYKPLKEKISFGAKERLQEIYVEIVDDDIWEPDEIFFVKLSLYDENQKSIVLGKTSITQITIINDDEPGKFEFSKPSYIVRDSVEKAQLFVNRINGADGKVSVKWKTVDLTAKNGKDYVGGEGTLTFTHGETSKTLDIKILDSDLPERDHNFQVELSAPTDGADIGKINKCIVTLVNDSDFEGLVSRITNQTKKNLDGLRLDTSSWKRQFDEAMNVNGGDIENARLLDYILHFCSFFWKVLFAFIPPPSIGGGWLTFVVSLVFIGAMTAIVGDLATVFGCLIGLDETVTAITLVALGTSMPDTFASRTAAINEKTADSSIGNINGSNAVNVFLGLGLPYVIASIYWEAKGQTFDVPTETLVFSVILYTSCSLLTTILLVLRRNLSIFGKAELGGPKVSKIISAIIISLLWVFYIIMSSMQAYDIISINI